MRINTILRTVAGCALAAGIMTGFCGCGQAKDSTNGSIVVIVKSQQSPEYWNVVNKGALDAGEEENYSIVLKAPELESDISVQQDMVKEAISEKAAAIVIAPTNTEDLNDPISSAVEAGIPVVTIDARCSLDSITYIGTDNHEAGCVAGREARKLLTGSKKTAVIALQEGSAVSDQRSGGFIDIMSEDTEVVFLPTEFCGADRSTAKSIASRLIDENPDLELIYAVNQTSTLGVCDAVKEKGLSDKVNVIGFDSSDEEIDFMSEGVLDGFVVQNPYNMGYLGVRNAVKMINGETVALTIDTGTTFVNNQNINDADVQLLIHPLAQ